MNLEEISLSTGKTFSQRRVGRHVEDVKKNLFHSRLSDRRLAGTET